MIILNSIPTGKLILRAMLVTLFINCFYANAQTDTVFWFAAPDLNQEHSDRPVFLRIATFSSAATVSVSQPANPAFTPLSVNIPANSSQSIDLTPFLNLIESRQADTILNTALLIRSTSLISCYYDIAGFVNGDIYSLKGNNALGLKFTIPFQQAFGGRAAATYQSAFIIAATEDNTSVTITPSNALVGHPANIPFTVVLNKGQVYVGRAPTYNPLSRPGGTVVVSDKKITISIVDDSIGYPGYTCGDTMGDQLLPDHNSGSEFIVVKGYLHRADYIFVFAIYDSTKVWVDGILRDTINAGEYFQDTVAMNSVYIQTSRNVHLLHVSGFGCELGGAVVPSLRCTGSNSVSVTRAGVQPFFLNIIAPPDIIDDFMINGSDSIIPDSLFFPVPATNGEWMYARILVYNSFLPAGSSARITNPSGKFHLGIIHGTETSTTRYGFFSDYSKTGKVSVDTRTAYCYGTDILIAAVYNGVAEYTWTGPGGFQFNGQNLSVPNFQPVNEGVYSVTAETGVCGELGESVYIRGDNLNADYQAALPQCVNENSFVFVNNSTVDVGTILSTQWKFGDGTSATGDSVVHVYDSAGEYSVKLEVLSGSGCVDSVSHLIKVLPVGRSVLTASICPGSSYLGYTEEGIYTDTLLSENGCDSLRTVVLSVKPRNFSNIDRSICEGESFLGYAETGIYSDTLTGSNGCDSIRTLKLKVAPKPVPSFSILNREGCPPLEVGFINNTIANSPLDYSWNYGDGSSGTDTTHIYSQTGQYLVSLSATDSLGCSSSVSDTGSINVYELPRASFYFSPDPSPIGNSTIRFYDESQGAVNWLWNFGDLHTAENIKSPVHQYEQPGIFIVTLYALNEAGCKDSAFRSVYIYPLDEIHIPNTFTPNGDQLNDEFYVLGIGIRQIEMMIFNRWGELVFSSTSDSPKWNGKKMGTGKDCNMGNYVYQIRLTDSAGRRRLFKGNLLLLR